MFNKKFFFTIFIIFAINIIVLSPYLLYIGSSKTLNIYDCKITPFFISIYTSLIFLFFKNKISEKLLILEKDNKNIKENQESYLEILNSTNNIIFTTDFKEVFYNNKGFERLLFNRQKKSFLGADFYIMDMFVSQIGYLSKDLIKKGENFFDLLNRTPEIERIVSIMDLEFIPKAYKISIEKLKSENKYLISLSDITKIKENIFESSKGIEIDGLTKVNNKIKFEKILDNEIILFNRYQVDLSLAIISIDNFKLINDNYGHSVGDDILITISNLLSSNIRNTDSIARWSGKEFILLFKSTSIRDAIIVSENLINIVSGYKFNKIKEASISIGLSSIKKNFLKNDLIESAYFSLKKSKNNGKNQLNFSNSKWKVRGRSFVL